MSGTIRYYCTGWSARFGNWHAEVIECESMATAKRRFAASYPTLKQVKAYPLSDTLTFVRELSKPKGETE